MSKSIALDFDGVIHPYNLPFDPENLPEPPTEECKRAINYIRKELGFEIYILSTRCLDIIGLKTMKKYLAENGIEIDGFISSKSRCKLYVDDRAHRFNGNWGKLIKRLKDPDRYASWHKKKKTYPNSETLCSFEHQKTSAMEQALADSILQDFKRHPLFSNIYPEAVENAFEDLPSVKRMRAKAEKSFTALTDGDQKEIRRRVTQQIDLYEDYVEHN